MLEVRGLHAGYGERKVLRGIDLDVARGEVVALAGPNGCGKTTLLRAVSGVHAPTAGDVTIDGRPLRAMRAATVAREVAVVAQAAALPEGFTAFEIALMGRTPHLKLLQSESMADVEIVRVAMTRAGCWDLRHRWVQELSGGERQRVVIARALAQEAALLLLDEPTSHLDIQHQVEAFRLLVSLSREQMLAVVAVVHDLSLAAAFADRIALMDGGRIVADGAPADVLTRDLLGRVYGVQVRILRHPDSGRPVVVPETGGPIVQARVAG